MKKSNIITLSIFGTFILVMLLFTMTMFSQRNRAVELEELINAQLTSNKSEYDNMWKKFKELAQVTDQQAEHFKDVYTDMIIGRYDDGDTLMKMVQESNPQLSSEVYTQLQREISAGRNTFNNSQKKISDLVREYNTYVRKHFIMSGITGRSVMDSNKFIVTSERTDDAFNSGKDSQVNIFDGN